MWIKENKTIDILEERSQWEEIYLILKNIKLPECEIRELLRIITEAWYVMCLGCLEDELFNKYLSLFQSAIFIGEKKYYSDFRFLAIYGYIISVSPHLFNDEKDEKEILREAYLLSNENQFVYMLYLGTTNLNSEYHKVRNCICENKDYWFKGDSAIERYFRDIVSLPDWK